MNHMHNDERTFWKTMTPFRCMVLFSRFFGCGPKTEAKAAAQPSLSAYLMGRG